MFYFQYNQFHQLPIQKWWLTEPHIEMLSHLKRDGQHFFDSYKVCKSLCLYVYFQLVGVCSRTAGCPARARVISEPGLTTPESAIVVRWGIEERRVSLHMRGLTVTRSRLELMTRRTPWLSTWPSTTRPRSRTRTCSPSRWWRQGRQLREAQKIANDILSGQLINGRNEHITPAFQQLAPKLWWCYDRGVIWSMKGQICT